MVRLQYHLNLRENFLKEAEKLCPASIREALQFNVKALGLLPLSGAFLVFVYTTYNSTPQAFCSSSPVAV